MQKSNSILDIQSIQNHWKKFSLIDAFDNVGFEKVAEKCTNLLKGKLISLVTDSQHLHQMDIVEKILTKMELK